MHGFSSVSALLVNAEVDSMGGVVESGDGVGNKTSSRCVVIEKVQAELRQEYDVREERRRELEFLEKGGNPLDFKIGNAASVSVQSTSLTDHNTDQFVTSEAKGSFAITASPHGDSVESSGRPGAPLSCEPNSADNLMLFDGENEFSEGDRNSLHPHRNNIAPSEHSLRFDGSQNPKELGDSATFGLPRKAYKRRYRSRPSRNGARSGSHDVFLAYGGHGSLPLRHSPRDVKGPISHAENQDIDISLKCNSKPTSPKGGTHVNKTSVSDGQRDTELDGASAVESSKDLIKGGSPNVNTSKFLLDGQLGQQSLSGADEAPNEMATDGLVIFEAREEAISTGIECQPTLSAVEVENQYNTCPVNDAKNDTQYRSAACGTKGLHSESACTHPSQIIDGNNDSEMYPNAEDSDWNGNNRNQISVLDGSPFIEGDELVKQNKETKADVLCISVNEECSQSHQENGLVLKADEELNGSVSPMQNEAKDQVVIEGMQAGVSSGSELERQPNVSMGDNSECKNKNLCNVKHKVSLESSNSKLFEGAALARVVSTVTPEGQTSGPGLVLTSKAAEDSILEEAQIIEAKRKRILELSTATLPLEKCRKSQWAYVLEEMAWLANDFAQERLWKLTAAAQICHRVAFTSQLKKQESLCTKIKKVAHSLAKAVMDFWHSVEDTSKELERQYPEKDVALGIHSYALRFLKYNNSDVLRSEAEEPITTDRISDMEFLNMSGKDHLIEENLFYTVPPGALQSYRRSIESHLIQCEKTGSSMQEEVETSAYDAVEDFESQANAYEEDEGETIKYDMTVAFEDRKFSRFVPTNRKHLTNAYISRSYEAGPDSSLMHCMENKAGKRPSSSLNVTFPTKRVRTASRRVFSPYSAGTSGPSGCVQLPNKTDASSGDTNSFQDDQSTLHGGPLVPNSLEVESLDELGKQLPVDCEDVSTRPKKKKKAKHPNNAFEQRWQMDSNFCNEQREHLGKRSEGYQLESNGSNGLFGQHMMKKLKVMQQLLDNSFDNVTPTGGSVPSPVASQMSNMPNPNKFIKMLGGRDRNRKTRVLKTPAGHMGSGSPWSLLEDQALIVLVHDMGPNWELVCDALNSTLQFKCIFRKPNECKEHHKILMDRTSGDGADSAEDSGSSQPYPSTLPGIPKGSARQLFQRLQGPVEEDTLKFHFEKIIMIGQKQNYKKKQDSIKLPDCSHTVALSQVCPNNLNGGTTLTPLDLCDTTTSSSDMISLGYQGAHSSGLIIPNQGTMAQMLPASGAACAVQGSSNLVIGNNFSSPVPLRDGRYGVPRSASLSIDEQQRVQQYNQMMSGRNIQQTTMSTPGTLSGTDRGVRILPGGNGIGMVGGINRTMPMTRPGFQGIATSSMVNSGSMVSPGMVSMPSAVNMHSGVGSGQGNLMLRPRDSLHMMRPGISLDSQRQIMVPDVQMQVSPGNSRGLSPFGGLASSFPNQTATPPVSSHPLQNQQSHPMSPQQSQVLSSHHSHVQGANHAPSPQQQAIAIHLAKERHLHHQFLQEQQQRQFAASNTLMSHGKPQPQLPISSPMRNSAQIQNQTSSAVSLAPSTSASSLNSMLQNQQKHQLLSPGTVRNAQTSVSGLTNQMGKQQSRQQQQQFSQANRQHPQQRQQLQSQQQTKHVKGVGRGNLMHQNIQIDPSLSNGVSKNLGNQSAEKGEAPHLMQGQGINSGSAVNAGQSARKSPPLQSSNQSLAEQNIYSGQAPSSSKHKHQMTTHSDSTHVPAVSPGPELSSGHHAASNHQQAQQHQQSQVPDNQNLVNQNQPALHRVMQQNHQLNSNLQNKPQSRDSEFDQHPASISIEIGARMTLPQPCNNATNVAQVFHNSAPRWNASEHSFDPSNLATNLGSMGSTSENSSEPATQNFQGPGQRQSPANLLSAQQLQQSQLQPTSSPVVPNSQSRVPQSGNGNSCGRPDPRLE